MFKSILPGILLLMATISELLQAAVITVEPRAGMSVTIEMSNVKELTFVPPYKILYKRDYNLSPLKVTVTVDARNITRTCNEGYTYDGANIDMELQSGIINKFLNNGSFDYKLVGRCRSGWFNHDDGRVRLSKTLGDVYLLHFTMLDFCIPNGDGSSGVYPSAEVYSIEPFPNMNLYGFVREGVNGRDPKSDEANFWDPPVEYDDPKNDDWQFDNNNRRNKSRCETYGRPAYGVNLRALVPGILDKEYEMTTAGPTLDLTRYHAPGFEGIFGKDWRSSVEYTAITNYFSENTPADVTIMPGRGLNHSFTYEIADSAFHPVEFKTDSLLLENKQLVWMEGETGLFHYFSTPDSTGLSYIDSISDRFGNKLRFTYTTDMKLQAIADNTGRTVTFEWLNNKVHKMIVPDGRTANYTYDNQNRIENTYDLEGLHTKFAYDEFNNISSFTFEGKTTVFEYDTIHSRSFLKSITDPTGETTQYRALIFSNFSMTHVTDPEGNEVSYLYNERFDITEIRYGNKENYYQYNEEGLLKTFERPDGTEVNYTYDSKQRLKTTSKIYNRDFGWVATETFDYDEQGNLKFKRDALNNEYRYRYDANGLLKSYTTPDNDSILYSYNASGRVAQMLRSNGDYNRFVYDAFGNLSEMSDNMGIVFRAEYDLSGQFLRKITDAAGQTIFYTYDNNKRLKTITTPDLLTTTYNYGCCALESQTNGKGQTIYFGRNELNQLSSYSFGNLYNVSMKYDKNHRLSEIQGDDGSKTSVIYNSEGLPMRITKPDMSEIEYSYDDLNQVESVTDESGRITRYAYTNERLSSVTDAADNSVFYRYDAAGNKKSVTNSRDNFILYDYDYNGAITKKTTPTGTYTYKYDYASRLTREDGPHGFTTYGYDIRSNITRINWNNSDSITMTYNPGGKMTAMVYPDKTNVSYSYDAYNRISRMNWNNQTIDIRYNNIGFIEKISRSNGWNTQHTYDQDGRLQAVSHVENTDTVIKLLTLYHPKGSVASEEVKWDILSGISTLPHTNNLEYNNLNQIVTNNDRPYIYDKDGNLTAIGNQLTAVYNDENYITSLITNQNSNAFTYNGLHQLVKEDRNGNQTALFYDQAGRLLFEKNMQEQFIRKYYYAGTYLIAQEYNDKIYFYHYDRQGTTLCLTTSSGGKPAITYWHNPFGEKLADIDSINNRFTFLGNEGVIDLKNGYYLMGARCYSSSDGRFLQRDPKGMMDGTNLYAYAMNNPTNYKDPTGLDVANGTADLFSCEGPEYLDSDMMDEDTYDWMGDVIDKGTDSAPIVGDVKGGAKIMYYLYKGKYKDAAWEMANTAGGFVGGRYLKIKMKGKFGDEVTQKTAENVAETVVNMVGNAITDVGKKIKFNPPSTRPSPVYDQGVPYITGSRPGRF